MIQDKTASAIAVTGTMGGVKHALGIDPAAMAHIMNVLTDLYSDPEYAVLREYSTNALDAQIEAGYAGPIDVSLPSPLSPFLKVRDYGVGLSEEDIADIYSRYGASTKRNTNTQVGMLGLGCKSALTYVSQFTIVSVKDGNRVQVAVSREEEGGSMTVVDERPTDDANGTEITIPVKRGHEFEAKAKKFFQYWQPGTVRVNGAEPKRVDGLWLNDKLLIMGDAKHDPYGYNRNRNENTVVMGNVPYPVEPGRNLDNLGLSYGHSLVAFVDIGDVDFVPSREALNYSSKRTLDTLKALSDEYKRVVPGAIQRHVDKAKTNHEALEVMTTWHAIVSGAGSQNYTFKGQTLPREWTNGKADGYSDGPDARIAVVPRRSHVQNRHQTSKAVSADLWTGALWVYGYDGKKFSAPQKQKLLMFIEGRSDEAAIQNFILTKDHPAGVKPWVAKDRIVHWDKVNAMKLARATTYGSYKDAPGSYDNCVVNGDAVKELEAKDIDTSNPIYVYDGSWYHIHHYGQIIGKHQAKHTIVPLPANRRDKFMRLFPQATSVVEATSALAKKWAKKLTKDQRRALGLAESHHGDQFRKLDPTKVDDPALKEACRLAKIDLTSVLRERMLYRDVLGTIEDEAIKFHNPLNSYPLFDQYKMGRGSLTEKHTYLYLNAAYAAQQKGDI